MAGTVAGYVVVSDASSELKIGDNQVNVKDFDFTIPDNAAVTKQPSILSLMVHSMGAAKALKANVSIRPPGEQKFIQVWSYGPTDADLTRPFHEVVKTNQNALKIGTNRLKVTLESGQGTFRVSDIVVWFQNNV
jgi:hypothetical protein